MKKPNCIYCQSSNITSMGSRWQCKDCQKTFVKKPKYQRTWIEADNREKFIKEYYIQNKEKKLQQYLARMGKTLEEYNANKRVDYDLALLRNYINKHWYTSIVGLAEDIGVSDTTIHKLFNNPSRTMCVKNLNKFEVFFGKKFKL